MTTKQFSNEASIAAGTIKGLAQVLEDIECGYYEGPADRLAGVRLAVAQAIVDKAGSLESAADTQEVTANAERRAVAA